MFRPNKKFSWLILFVEEVEEKDYAILTLRQNGSMFVEE